MKNASTTWRWLLPLLAGWSVSGCSTGAKQYWVNRGRDVRDILDWDCGVGPGLAVKLELTHAVAPSLGLVGAREHHKRGRSADYFPGGGLGSLGIAGVEGTNPHSVDVYVMGINMALLGLSETAEQGKDWFRVGPKLALGYVTGGIYLNVAELLDSFGGWLGFDLMDDDEPYYPVEDPWEVRDEAMRVGFQLPQHLPALGDCTILALLTGMPGKARLQEVASAAAARVIGERAAGDEMGLVWFGSRGTSCYPDSGKPLACDENGKATLLEALGRIPPEQDGPLTEGIEAAIELARASSARTKAIVVFTSGQAASTDRGDAAFLLKRAAELTQAVAGKPSIHVVLIGPAQNGVGVFLEALMAETHGKLVRVSSATSWQGE